MTWGRIRVRVKTFSKDKRLKELVEKYNEDVKWANIEENYFK